ncbi:MAG: M23 family metallopeptidase [Bifidobacteriaceae bacterium]|jgi:hypothetical protein|nr:M23 family metallopeptidase [Bifidobacteriaceae bacterium]
MMLPGQEKYIPTRRTALFWKRLHDREGKLQYCALLLEFLACMMCFACIVTLLPFSGSPPLLHHFQHFTREGMRSPSKIASSVKPLGKAPVTSASYNPEEVSHISVLCSGNAELPVRLSDVSFAKRIVKEFSPPKEQWLAGHRGIDIKAPAGAIIVAPAQGVVTFAGMVAGKNEVSIKTGQSPSLDSVVFSFEPATTTLRKGDSVAKGAKIATVTGHSDHCDGSCVHWGARKNGSYVDPRTALTPVHIILKPNNP